MLLLLLLLLFLVIGIGLLGRGVEEGEVYLREGGGRGSACVGWWSCGAEDGTEFFFWIRCC